MGLTSKAFGSMTLHPVARERIPFTRVECEREMERTKDRIAYCEAMEEAWREKIIAAGGTPTTSEHSVKLCALKLRLVALRRALDGFDAAEVEAC